MYGKKNINSGNYYSLINAVRFINLSLPSEEVKIFIKFVNKFSRRASFFLCFLFSTKRRCTFKQHDTTSSNSRSSYISTQAIKDRIQSHGHEHFLHGTTFDWTNIFTYIRHKKLKAINRSSLHGIFSNVEDDYKPCQGIVNGRKGMLFNSGPIQSE